MYKLCIIVMCCAFLSWGSAAPNFLDVNPRSQLENSAEQSEELQEETQGQESIISKVGVFAL